MNCAECGQEMHEAYIGIFEKCSACRLKAFQAKQQNRGEFDEVFFIEDLFENSSNQESL